MLIIIKIMLDSCKNLLKYLDSLSQLVDPIFWEKPIAFRVQNQSFWLLLWISRAYQANLIQTVNNNDWLIYLYNKETCHVKLSLSWGSEWTNKAPLSCHCYDWLLSTSDIVLTNIVIISFLHSFSRLTNIGSWYRSSTTFNQNLPY